MSKGKEVLLFLEDLVYRRPAETWNNLKRERELFVTLNCPGWSHVLNKHTYLVVSR